MTAATGTDEEHMAAALSAGAAARLRAYPNPWVGCALVTCDGRRVVGATRPRGQAHAEIAAIEAARAEGLDLAGSTAYVTLEPCAHVGRTAACAPALVAAGVVRVVVAVLDPDERTTGRGVEHLEAAGVQVDVGACAAEAARELAPYLRHRRERTPFVTVKLASTLDGRTAAPDGSSRWITGPDARADVHALRAAHDAVLVGRGTVAADDPSLTVRDAPGADPVRVVLGRAPQSARVFPAVELTGEPREVVAELGARDLRSVLVEGGATTAGSFQRAGLVDRFVLYVAPALLGGDDGHPVLAGAGAPTMDGIRRGRLLGARPIGQDVRIDVELDAGGS